MSDAKKPFEQTQSSFKVDHDASGVVEMPSVTRLLNRKKLGLGTGSTSMPPAAPPPRFETPPEAPPPLPASSASEGPVLEPLTVVSDHSPAPEPGLGEIKLELDHSEPVLQSTPSVPVAAPPASSLSPSASGGMEIALSDGPSRVEIHSSSGPALSTGGSPTVELSVAPSVSEAVTAPSTPSVAERVTAPGVAPAAAIAPVVQINRRAAPRKAATAPLANWTKATLIAGSDPLGKGLLELNQAGAPSALFLSARNESNQIVFGATAALDAGARQGAWAGIKLNPAHFPDLWAKLLKEGVAEFSPPGQATDIGSLRNLVRGAFATRSEEWLTFYRAGTPANCRGVLVVFSKSSLKPFQASALRLIGTPVVVKKAA
jgi:hypothetical protein